MIMLIKQLRLSNPSVKIMYSIPAFGSKLAPWSHVADAVFAQVDYLQVNVYDFDYSHHDVRAEFRRLSTLGVPYERIVYGVMPGAHDYSQEFTSIVAAQDLALYISHYGLAGVALWSINRDTDHRNELVSDLYQTRTPDGTFAKDIRCNTNSDCQNTDASIEYWKRGLFEPEN
mmetsp:Transcript_3178/g.6570  ORF Transcript_3178/g.6570 Transcript_3178/m.6570 type:complete len:173 (-) Transcript_3178:236-754(-)